MNIIHLYLRNKCLDAEIKDHDDDVMICVEKWGEYITGKYLFSIIENKSINTFLITDSYPYLIAFTTWYTNVYCYFKLSRTEYTNFFLLAQLSIVNRSNWKVEGF